jgi:phospholipase C
MAFANPDVPQQVIEVKTTDESIQRMRNSIKHVVVMVLENRSFDSMLGKLYPKSSSFDGLSGDEFCTYFDEQGIEKSVKVWNDPQSFDRPKFDPNESFDDIQHQLFGTPDVPESAPTKDSIPTMNGFVQNFYKVVRPSDPSDVMFYYLPEQLPVLST